MGMCAARAIAALVSMTALCACDDAPKGDGAVKDQGPPKRVQTKPDPAPITSKPPDKPPAKPPTAPVKITECKAAKGSVGAWRPTIEQVVAAAKRVPWKACLEGEQVADVLKRCAADGGGVTPEVTVETPGFTGCVHTVRSLENDGRRFVYIEAFVGVGAKFHAEAFIYEMEKDGPIPYYTGFSGTSALCVGKGEIDPKMTSARMKADWPKLPEPVKAFMCGLEAKEETR